MAEPRDTLGFMSPKYALRSIVGPLVVSLAFIFALACNSDTDDSAGHDPTPLVAATPTTIPLVNAASICASTNAATSATVASPDIVEASGMAVSRAQGDVIWVHNDSGDSARVFAINAAGETLATYDLPGVQTIDWEDIAIGPGPGQGDFLYVGDIGDNPAEREHILVYRFLEPAVDSASSDLAIPDAVAIEMRYEDGPHDAETLLIDPISGDLLVITKELVTGRSGVFRAAASELAEGSPVTLRRVGEIDFFALRTQKEIPEGSPALANVTHVPTGGDVSPDGSVVALRTYATVWIWDRWPGSPLAEAFTGTACEGPSEVEPQGEAMAFGEAGASYFTLSEGQQQPLHQFKFD